MTVCYDLRFPELYRILAVRGARLITVPSAFTLPPAATTGRFCCAPARSRTRSSWSPPGQFGKAPPHYDSYGHSVIVDPWGVVLAMAPDEECFVAADLDFARAGARPREASLARQPPRRAPTAGRRSVEVG